MFFFKEGKGGGPEEQAKRWFLEYWARELDSFTTVMSAEWTWCQGLYGVSGIIQRSE